MCSIVTKVLLDVLTPAHVKEIVPKAVQIVTLDFVSVTVVLSVLSMSSARTGFCSEIPLSFCSDRFKELVSFFRNEKSERVFL